MLPGLAALAGWFRVGRLGARPRGGDACIVDRAGSGWVPLALTGWSDRPSRWSVAARPSIWPVCGPGWVGVGWACGRRRRFRSFYAAIVGRRSLHILRLLRCGRFRLAAGRDSAGLWRAGFRRARRRCFRSFYAAIVGRRSLHILRLLRCGRFRLAAGRDSAGLWRAGFRRACRSHAGRWLWPPLQAASVVVASAAAAPAGAGPLAVLDRLALFGAAADGSADGCFPSAAGGVSSLGSTPLIVSSAMLLPPRHAAMVTSAEPGASPYGTWRAPAPKNHCCHGSCYEFCECQHRLVKEAIREGCGERGGLTCYLHQLPLATNPFTLAPTQQVWLPPSRIALRSYGRQHEKTPQISRLRPLRVVWPHTL